MEAEIEAITPLHSIGALLLNTSSLKGSLKVCLVFMIRWVDLFVHAHTR